MLVDFTGCKVRAAKETSAHAARHYVVVGRIVDADFFFSWAGHEGYSHCCLYL